MVVVLTKHYQKRFRQRQAKTSRMGLFTERAYIFGKQPSKYRHDLYSKMLTEKERAYDSIAKVYNGFVYWFVGNKAITIYPLPSRVRGKK